MLTGDAQKLGKLIESTNPAQVLDWLRSAYEGKRITGTTSDGFSAAAKTFFGGIGSVNGQGISAKILATSAFELVAQAKQDMAVRNALMALSPIALTLPSYQQDLSLYDVATGNGQLSDKWLEDRAGMLTWLKLKLKMGTDGPISNAIGGPGSRYFDQASNTEVLIGTLPTDRKQYLFGSNNSDTLSGQDLDDHLFGGQGGDKLSGAGGEDYLEGDDGDDTIDAGAGNDTVLGGAGADDIKGGAGTDKLSGDSGDDTLDGGADADILVGGKGNDKYSFNGGYGSDTIKDEDGLGSIQVDGQTLPFAAVKKLAENTYRDKATGWRFIKAGVQPDGSATLVIQKDGSTNSITIRNWKDGQLGITLNDTLETAATGLPLYLGDQRPLIYGTEISVGANTATTYAWNQVTRDTASGNLTGQSTAQANFSDVLTGSLNNDDIRGLGGNDALSGGEGNDLIDGGTGDDLIGGGLGQDTIKGGEGNDQIFSGLSLRVQQAQSPSQLAWAPPAGGTTVASGTTWGAYLTAGQRQIIFDGVSEQPQDAQADQIDGGAGNDYILAGFGNDHVDGGDDDDDINGLAGNDILLGGSGADTILGDGPDLAGYLYSTPASLHGNDVLDGGNGDDILFGQGGQDELYGGANDDKLWGDDRNKAGTPWAMHDNDYLDGGSGNDTLYGGGKDDTLYGGVDNDTLFGDDSQSVVDVSFHGKDYLDGEDGSDQLVGGGNDDELFGGADNDTLWGDDTQDLVAVSAHGNDYLDGEDGADYLFGGGNDDTLFGGIGNDILWGDDDLSQVGIAAHGNDYLDGEDGEDTLIGGGKDDTLFGGIGNDTLYGDQFQDAEAAGDGADYLSGEDGTDLLVGGGGNDTLDGGEGGDTLYGGSGQNLLDGGAGADHIYSESAGDTLVGGAGNDTFYINFSGAGVTRISDTDGTNTVVFESIGSDDLAWSELLGALAETRIEIGSAAIDVSDLLSEDAPTAAIIGIDGRRIDHLGDLKQELAWHITGSADSELIQGSARDDVLLGQGGNDTLVGNDGFDYISDGDGANRFDGGDGNDTMVGGNFGDTFAGGKNDDNIFGGAGDDVYEFNLGDGEDYIIDDGGADTIRFGAGLILEKLTISGTPDLRLTFKSGEELYVRNGALGVIERFEFADGHVLNTDQLMRAVSPANDGGLVLDTPEVGGLVYGGTANDTLRGLSGDDTLIGLAGDDTLLGSGGNDTYVFQAGSGTDTIIDQAGGGNSIRFKDIANASGISAQIEYIGETPVLVLRRSDTNDAIRLVDPDAPGISQLVFSDDSTLSLNTWLSSLDLSRRGSEGSNKLHALDAGGVLQGLGGDDTLLGASGEDVLYGGKGNDVISGAGGADTLAGGEGGDVLLGGTGVDTYIWQTTDGDDRLIDASESNRIQIQDLTDFSILSFRRQGQDLVMMAANNASSLTIEGHFNQSNNWTLVGASGQEANVNSLYSQYIENNAASVDHDRAATAQSAFLARSTQRQQIELVKLSSEWFRGAPSILISDFDQAGKCHRTGISANDPNTTVDLVIDRGIKTITSNLPEVHLESRYWATNRTGSVVTGWGTQYQITHVREAVYPTPEILRFIPRNQMQSGVQGDIGEYVPLIGPSENGIGSDQILGYYQMKLPKPGDVQYIQRTITTTVSIPKVTSFYESDLSLISLVAGDSDNNIGLTTGNALVDAGSGNDFIHGDSLPIEALRYEILSQEPSRTFLYGNSGNDTIVGTDGTDELMGGTGNDLLNGGASADVYRIDSGAGWDTIMDTEVLTFSVRANGEFPGAVAAVNKYLEQIGEKYGNSIPLTTAALESARAIHADGFWVSQPHNFNALLDGEWLAGIPLASDQDWLSSVYAQSQQPVDIVQFGDGIDFNDLARSYGTLSLNGKTYRTLDIGVPSGGVRIVLADDNQAIGYGVERFRFANGDEMSMAEMLFQTPITGTPGNDRLMVVGRRSQLQGGGGDDIYVINNIGSVVIETPDGGNDTIETTSAEFSLEGYANVENLTLVRDLTEDEGSSLFGNSGNNKIQGANSPDAFFGLNGNDTLDGRGGDDLLEGGAGDDLLIGGAGADTMDGGAGHDVYEVDNINDTVIETTPGEYDRVVTSVNFTLADQVEDMTLAYGANTALKATGNALDNTLEGNEFDNVISGLDGNDYLWGDAGNDTLIGGLGNDQIFVDSVDDVILEDANGGYDTVVLFNLVADTYTLADNVEAAEVFLFNPATQPFATLKGNALDNSLTAGSDGSALYGENGDDQLFGGVGNDSLYGGADNDALWGQSGADSVLGGTGNDQYYVSDANNRITEYANEGMDKVTLFDLTTNSYTLSDNVEYLDVFLVRALSGDVITLTGNAQNNGIEGNANGDPTQRYAIFGGQGDDTLFGSVGNDSLDGGVGNDLLRGGEGSDTYLFRRGDGQDVVDDTNVNLGDTDRLVFDSSVANDQLWFSMSGQDLVVSVIGTTDRVTIQKWSAGAANHVEQFSAGGKTLADTQVANLVQAMASMSPPASGQITLSSTQRAQLDPVLAANWA